MAFVRNASSISEDLRASGTSSRGSSRPESPFDPQASLILRIKRKRGVDPITALRIETLNSDGGQRSGEDSHGLHTSTSADTAGTSPEEYSRAQTRRRLADRGVFRLAETVPLKSFNSKEKTKQLEDRIARLKRPTINAAEAQVDKAKDVQSAETARKQPLETRSSAANLRFKVVTQTKSARRSLFDTLKANNNSNGSLRAAQKHARTISKSKRLSALSSRPRYIDAVVDAGQEMTKRREKAEDEEMSALDKRFAGLLGDYLKDQDLQPPNDLLGTIDPSTEKNRQSASSDSESEDDEDDYVYDIYYRERESSSWGSHSATSAAEIGLRPSDVAGHERDLSNSTQLAAQAGPTVAPEAMATLVGLSEQDIEQFGDEEEIEKGSKLISEEMLDSDDPYEEGEDEDSNDEGFYRNDYPEQEAEDDDELLDASAWGWSGPRRRERGSDSDSISEEEEGSDGSF